MTSLNDMRRGTLRLAGLVLLGLLVSGCIPEAETADTGDAEDSAATAAVVEVKSNAQEAVRLLIEFNHGDFAILSQHSVRKTLPPSDAAPVLPASGWYFELQNASGETRYRRIIEDPVTLVFEGPDPDVKHLSNPDRSASVPGQRSFNLLMPAPQAGDEFVLFGPGLTSGSSASLQREAAMAGSGELARLLVSGSVTQ